MPVTVETGALIFGMQSLSQVADKMWHWGKVDIVGQYDVRRHRFGAQMFTPTTFLISIFGYCCELSKAGTVWEKYVQSPLDLRSAKVALR
jgi:hypothetical protein